jgi:Glycosyl transferase family 8
MSVLHVACAACRRYVPHSAAMLHSLLTHAAEEEVQVHYLHGPDLPPADRSRLSEMVERCGGRIAFVRVPDDRVSGLATTRSFPASIWYRTLLPELLPDLERVLYLDSDTIVIESLAPLWASDLRDDYIAAVTNVFKANRAGRLATLGLEPSHAYFNTGVLLMNLAALRRDDCMETLRDWARQHPDRLLWPEQDAMNVVLGSRRLALHPRWNCMNGLFRFRGARRSSASRRWRRRGASPPSAISRARAQTSRGTTRATSRCATSTSAIAWRLPGRGRRSRGAPHGTSLGGSCAGGAGACPPDRSGALKAGQPSAAASSSALVTGARQAKFSQT